jgi:DNA/RNA endonuclease YhcR with UshA esterase domain
MRILLALLATLLIGTGWAAGETNAPRGASIKGEVLEVRDVDAYTYLRLRTSDGEAWAAVGKTPVQKGAEVTIENAVVMHNFESKTLKRTFDKIAFGSLAGAGGAPAGGDLAQMHGGFSRAADVGDIKVAKAKGADARTVAEIVGKRSELKDKPVTVSGKVVKSTSGVMGKNWLHLRDGTGAAADGTNDVVVTTKDEAAVGDVVTAKGVVRTDVDLGSGYTYKVLVDSATLQK